MTNGRVSFRSAQLPALHAISSRATLDDIERFLGRPETPRRQTAPLSRPAGDPTGSGR
ncbi:MAG: hypothetical protein H0T92_09195 [Pyrinomonadaceae bacterium]|nr:hypothetical protein [Pyrinomonadaceae bacterium]